MLVHGAERNRGDERSAGPQNPPAFGQDSTQIRDMFNHAVGKDRGENAVGESEPAGVHAAYTAI